MIQVQRAYEINSKAVSTTDQMLQKPTQQGRWWGYATGSLILKMAYAKYASRFLPSYGPDGRDADRMRSIPG